jgi:hypothetical protein
VEAPLVLSLHFTIGLAYSILNLALGYTNEIYKSVWLHLRIHRTEKSKVEDSNNAHGMMEPGIMTSD